MPRQQCGPQFEPAHLYLGHVTKSEGSGRTGSLRCAHTHTHAHANTDISIGTAEKQIRNGGGSFHLVDGVFVPCRLTPN